MRFRLVLPFIVALFALSACRDAKVVSYRTPHENPDPLPPILTGGLPAGSTAASGPGGGGMASTAVPTASGDDLTWTAPTRWKPTPGSAMRKGSYAVLGDGGATADMSITAFPGDVGGELANVNRWRGQVDLPPVGPDELPGVTTHLEQGGLSFVVVDFASNGQPNPRRILGALVPFNGATWFFKLMGPDALVAREKPAFLDFLKTVKPPAPTLP